VIGFGDLATGIVVAAELDSACVKAAVGFEEVGLLLDATGFADDGFSTGAALAAAGGVAGFATAAATASVEAAGLDGLLNHDGTVEAP
jgi:hypothetical protein